MRSIRFQLVALLFITLLPAFAMLLLLANLERQRAEVDTANESMAVARLLRAQFATLVASTRETLELMVHYDAISEGSPAECADRLEEIFPLMEGYTGFWVADETGTLLCAMSQAGPHSSDNPRPDVNTSVADNAQYQLAWSTGEFISAGLRTGQITGTPVYGFAIPSFDASGNVVRVLGTGRDLGTLNRDLIATDFPEDASLVLLDGTCKVALADPPMAGMIGSVLPAFAEIQRQVSDEGVTTGHVEAAEGDENGITYVWVAGKVGGNVTTGWTQGNATSEGPPPYYALVGYTEDRATGSLWRALRTMLIGFGAIKVAALLVAFFAAELLIVRRIEKLLATARRMRDGDLSARTDMKPNSGEIGELAQSLDSLAASLQTREAENKRLIGEVETLNSDLEHKFNMRTEELQRANRQLLVSQQELRQLSQQLMRLTEQERTRISREIHDQLGQALTAIKMELRNAQRKMESDPAEASRTLDSVTAQVDEMVTLVRRIAANLRPGVLDDFGLVAAIDWHVQDYCEKTGLKCVTEFQVDETMLNANLSTSAFRITQEALTNIARHAEASHVTIKGRFVNKDFTIEIQDDGKGFSAEDASKGEVTRSRSLGLLGMQERAAELGGHVTIKSEPGKGTLVRVVLPVEAALET